MASRVNSRPIRPPPSRKSNFLPGVPSLIYSQAPEDLRPPADYVGPRKSLMEKPPAPSMNPKKSGGFPVIAVSKLDVQVAVPPTSKTSLPHIDAECASNKVIKCAQAKSLLKSMPSAFRKQFRTEMRKKRPFKGSVKHFVHRDFHNPNPPELPVLHGILLLGGNHRDMVEELPQEPGTPPPVSGRRNCLVQTDTYLEDIGDNETGFISTEMQCEPIYDEPLEPNPVTFEEEGITTSGTQLDRWTFADISHCFDQLAVNLADSVIMESLKQLQEEFELDALRKQHHYHKCLRNREKAILAKYRSAQERHEEQKRILESRQPWDQTLDQIIELVGFEKIVNIAPLHFIGSQTNQAVYELLQETMVPPTNEKTVLEVERKKNSRNILDAILEETVLKKEAEYAGRMYIRDPKKKGSLASYSPSRLSMDFEEWAGEMDEEYAEIAGDYRYQPIDEYDSDKQSGRGSKKGSWKRKSEKGSTDEYSDAWDGIQSEQKRSTGSLGFDTTQPQGGDTEDSYDENGDMY